MILIDDMMSQIQPLENVSVNSTGFHIKTER